MQDRITKLFKAIADPTRREIFHALVIASSALSITEISNQFEMSRQGVTKHIKTLEDAGLVNLANQGRERFCNANAKPLKEEARTEATPVKKVKKAACCKGKSKCSKSKKPEPAN